MGADLCKRAVMNGLRQCPSVTAPRRSQSEWTWVKCYNIRGCLHETLADGQPLPENSSEDSGIYAEVTDSVSPFDELLLLPVSC